MKAASPPVIGPTSNSDALLDIGDPLPLLGGACARR